MAIAGLVIGILSVSVFFWAGPAIGGLWSASAAVSASLAGQGAAPPAWPVWVMGLSLGVGVPAIALFLSIGGLRQKKGVAIAGLVISAVGMLLGLMTTMGAAFAINMAGPAIDKIDAISPDLQQMQNTLDDPAFQDRIQKAMDAAAQNQPAAPTAETPPQGSTGTLMPGQTPPNVAPTPLSVPQNNTGEELPAEAPMPADPQ